MTTTCKKCGHICHCVSGSDHKLLECNCESCACSAADNKHIAENKTYENEVSGGLVIDDTDECESCQ
jgi:hypothetical protein